MGIFDKLKNAMSQAKQAAAAPAKAPEPKKLSYSERETIYRQNKINEFREILSGLRKVEIELSEEKRNRNNAIEMPEISPKNITKSTNLSKLRDFIAIDTETTGLKPGGNDVIEVSAVLFHDFEPVEVFSTLIKPRKPIPPDATAINGITDDMVQDAPRFYEIAPALETYLKKLPLVGHNIAFDLRHLFVNGLGSVDQHVIYDTLALSKKFCDDDILDHKLATVCKECLIYMDDAHRATADALACGLLFVSFILQSRDDCYDIGDLISKCG